MSELSTAVIQIAMSYIGSWGFAILFNVRGGKAQLAALGGTVSWALYLALGLWTPSAPYRYFFCACFAGLYAELLARFLKTPATTFLIPTMIPHIPGGSLYQTMQYALRKQWMDCLSQAFYTIKLALALALGFAVVLTCFNILGMLQQKRKESAAP